MSWINFKILKTNFIVFISILLVIEITSYLIYEYKFNVNFVNVDRYNISNEQDIFHQEVDDFRRYKYKAFIGWEAGKKSGDHVNISDAGRRFSFGNKNSPTEIALFGGSTMWGYGVSDLNTIPSIIGREGKFNAVNYAEQAYNSRQSLNLLINEKITSGDLVVFYDGVNDVYHNCLKKNSTNGHAREGYLRKLLAADFVNQNILNIDFQRGKYKMLSYSWTAKLIFAATGSDLNKLASNNNLLESREYVCDDRKKAEAVADFIISSWSSAEKILKSDGVNFKCILQPNPYTLKVKSHYHDEIWSRAVKDVYPIIREKANSLSCFIDASDWFDHDYYIDGCCHVNQEGNAVIARKLLKHLEPLVVN